MKPTRLLPVVVLLAGYSGQALAYELETHADMSKAAAKASALGGNSPNSVLRALGLQYPIEEDVKQVFPNSQNTPKSILELIRDGARFEDGLTPLDGRSLNHFFDPFYDRALTVDGKVLGEKSPDWALEDKGKVRYQEYSYKSVRDHFYQALTAASENDRKTQFGLTFQTLGQVIHHLQDMAQPQHVRNDPHCDRWYCVGRYRDPSRYEKETDRVRNRLPFANAAYSAALKQNPLFFPTARGFWITGTGEGIAEFTHQNFVSAGTNYQLFNGRPASNTTYLEPVPSGFGPLISIQNLFQEVGETTTLTGMVGFVENEVFDRHTGIQATNKRSASLSIFDQDIQTYGIAVPYTDPETGNTWQTNRLFTLNRFNFIAAHEFLIPRAVAYSAGLIDYFFRGKLEAEGVAFTDTGIMLRVKNAVDPVKTPAWANEILYALDSQQQPSTLTVAYEYKDAAGATQYRVSNTVPMTAEPGGVNGIAPGQTSQNVYSFTLSVPGEATEVKYRIVFRGRLGQEDNAVAVGPADPVSGFAFIPSYLPDDGIGGKRVIYKRGGQWVLSNESGLVASNIDWKGWYVNNHPTKVLSWKGPQLRYFPTLLNNGIVDNSVWSDEIFQNGEVSYAPRIVLGAALLKDATGKEWIIAICSGALGDIVYRRPNKKSDTSWEMYDPVNNPNGWEEIGRFTPAPGMPEPDRPWFFNGSGAEAQTMRRDDRVLRDGLTRLKVKLNASNATLDGNIEEAGNLEGQKTIYNDGGVTSRTVPPPTNPCASYTASTDQETSNGEVGQGEYLVAVDYQDDKEILATLTLTSNRNVKETYREAHQRSITCDVNGNVIDISGSDTESGTRNINANYRLVLGFSKTNLPLITDAEERKGSFEYTSNGAESIRTTNESLSHNHVDGSLFYLDLRYDLAVVQSTQDVAEGQCLPSLETPSGQVNETLGDKLEILRAGETVTVYNATRSLSGPYPPPCYLRGLPVYGSREPSTSTSELRPIFLQTISFLLGSWSADTNGNLFISQQYYKQDDTKPSVLNYLSGAPNSSPAALIPTAPANAVYLSIGVIR